MDTDLDDILNDGAPAVPSRDTSSCAAGTEPGAAGAPEVEAQTAPAAPAHAESSSEPMLEASPMSSESAVLVSACESKDNAADCDDGTSEAPTAPAAPAPVPVDVNTEKLAAQMSDADVKPAGTVAQADATVASATASQSKNNDGDDGGGWGLSSVTAALGGWGFDGSTDEADNTPSAVVESASAPLEEEEWKHQAEAVEDAAAAAVAFLTGGGPSAMTAAESVEEAVGGAASAASSFFSGASEFLAGANPTSDAAGAAEGASASTAPPTDADDPTASTLRSLYNMNPLNKLASGWIDDLERQNADADPHRDLRAHLDSHLKDWPRRTYEEWVEEALCALEGWDAGSAVVDDTFYTEDSVHRNVWNDYQCGEEEDEETKREFVPARGSAAGSPKAKAQPTKQGAAKAPAGGGGADDDADLDGLIDGEEEIVFVETPAKK